ncbi:NAD-dependent epimerase/dehydratase family protein [Acetobacterium bakii]|uniref:NAD-dependent epimerase n=1 Tax=Acetobacterium bakii TaxID=52689 RepID=A0A0L6U1X7_9FIRM|nr:NAD-dependent epimerase/dehydratase family protein [Acetobacterium bakii]KNZ42521.1 NAD-dependent epimerase [Acetobacterium bakii]
MKKRILITGASSYIGTSFRKWATLHSKKYRVDAISLRDESWKEKDFSAYDVVLHLAGIAHVDVKKATAETEALYYKVNRDLTIKTAEKAKKDGVEQFIFMSSIIVYGDSSHINKKRIINEDTIPQPSNFYGSSKLQAEEGIKLLADPSFKVAILRPPMIYGKGSKGNYPTLSKYAQKINVFPDIDNQRSMLHIDNLCKFMQLIINNNEQGLFFPQNTEYVKTDEMFNMIAQVHGQRIWRTKLFNPMLVFMANFSGVINKAFGNLVYEQGMSEYKEEYRMVDFRESIKITEV